MKPFNRSFQNMKHFDISLNRYRQIAIRPVTKNEHVYAIFCRLEVAGDVISGGNVKAVEGYAELHFEAASIGSFRATQNQPFVKCVDDGRPT